MSQYDFHAGCYDAVYEWQRSDIAFYVAEAQRAGSPVLELACGTGRVTIPVAQASIDVVGIDSSPAMLDRFRERLADVDADVQERITLVEADMRDFELGEERFNLVYCPFRSFLHLMTVEDQMACLETVRRHLRPDGRFALNFFQPSLEVIARSMASNAPVRRTQEFRHPVTGNKVIMHITTKHDVLDQIIQQYNIEDELDADGRVVSRTYKPLILRWIYRFEFEHLLARCGFEVEDLYGTFDRAPLTQEHSELVWIARKKMD